jgi:branched-chain amino acid transport system ATP-binding protein
VSAYFEFEEVSARYDKVRALRGVSLQLQGGEIIALIGANGAGKTTTLRAITGLVRVAAGEIRFDGQRIDTMTRRRSWRSASPWCPRAATSIPTCRSATTS